MNNLAQRLRIDASAGLVPDIVRADCSEAADRIAALEARCRELEADRAVIMDESIEQAGRIAELEAALRGLLDTLLVDGQRYGNSKQRMAQMRAQELLTAQETSAKAAPSDSDEQA